MHAGGRVYAFTSDAGGDGWHPPSEGIQDFYAHAAARPNRNDHRPIAPKVRLNVGDVPGKCDAAHRAQAVLKVGVGPPDDGQMDVRKAAPDEREDVVDKVADSVSVWGPVHAADEQQL